MVYVTGDFPFYDLVSLIKRITDTEQDIKNIENEISEKQEELKKAQADLKLLREKLSDMLSRDGGYTIIPGVRVVLDLEEEDGSERRPC